MEHVSPIVFALALAGVVALLGAPGPAHLHDAALFSFAVSAFGRRLG